MYKRQLGDIAQATGCAIVLIGHLNKAAGTQSTYRGLGSIDITAAVRSLLFIGKLKDSPTTRVLIHEKRRYQRLSKGQTKKTREAAGNRDVYKRQGHDRHPTECDCQRAAREKREAAESRQKHLETRQHGLWKMQ